VRVLVVMAMTGVDCRAAHAIFLAYSRAS